jgi:sorbose reductase
MILRRADSSAHMDPKLLDWQKKDLVPLQRFSEPEEQAYMTLLLLDPVMGAYCTGQEYFVDGGAQAW